MKLERFDMLIPESTKKTIYELAEERALSPRTFGRMVLVEKIREIAAGSIRQDQTDRNTTYPQEDMQHGK